MTRMSEIRRRTSWRRRKDQETGRAEVRFTVPDELLGEIVTLIKYRQKDNNEMKAGADVDLHRRKARGGR